MTVRELCDYKQVSLKTAFLIQKSLREEGILERRGRALWLAPALSISQKNARPLLIGFLATCLESPYFAKLACHAEEYAHSIGASLLIASSNYSFERERERLQMFCRQGVAGVQICPWASTPEQEGFYAELPVPYVMLGRRLETVECDAVLVNNQKAAQRMARHLLEQGLTEFAYIGQRGKQHDQRLFGFRAELASAGFALPDSQIIQVDGENQSLFRESMLQLLKRRKDKRLGVFCYHDLFAIRAINLCHQLGLRVPGDVAVAGFDDLPVASETYPSLTTVSYPVKDMARLAFETLYTKIRFGKQDGGVCRYLDSKIVVRESTQNITKE